MHFKHKQSVFQWVLFVLVMVLVLLLFGQMVESDILRAIGVSSLAASAFISFMLPKSPVAKTERIWFAYITAVFVGAGCSWLVTLVPGIVWGLKTVTWQEIFALLAVCITVLSMLLFKIPHPPAAGLALGLVLDDWSFYTVVAIICSISLIVIIKALFEPQLNNLC